jgi:hypothetical protein
MIAVGAELVVTSLGLDPEPAKVLCIRLRRRKSEHYREC